MSAIWLFKTEPDTFSLDDLQRQGRTPWDGVRNYQARNRLRDDVSLGDRILIYHSGGKAPAIVGEAEVVSAPYPDPSQFDPQHPGHDPRSSETQPRWYLVDVAYRCHYPSPLPLGLIKAQAAFADMELVIRPRLSIIKVSERQYLQLQELNEPSAALA